MQVLDSHTKFAELGKPGTAFSAGFARRFEIMKSLVDFNSKTILDAGCGEGVWLEEFAKITSPEKVYGSDIDPETAAIAVKNLGSSGIPASNIHICPGEKLDFPDNFFDIVFSNEVLEHVIDDKQAADEMVRVLKPGGKIIVFTPNRGWPFETHGMYWNNKYIWGNIPLLPWLPQSISKKFAPHVRNYSNKAVERLFIDQSVQIIYHKHVFPGFDGMVRRFGAVGRFGQRLFHAMEKTPLHWFGISHLLIVEKK